MPRQHPMGLPHLIEVEAVREVQQRLDLRLAWSSDDQRWGAAVFVTNLLDDQYITGVNNLTTDTFGTPFASISEPRQWGVEFSAAFR